MKNVLVIVFLLLLWGCGDPNLLNFDKLGKPEGWTPDYSLIIAKADFSMWDAFNQGMTDTATLKKEENGQLYLEYRRPGIYTLSAEEIYSMKAEDMGFFCSFPINGRYFDPGEGTTTRPYYDTLTVDYLLEQIPEDVSIQEALLSVRSMAFVIMNNAHIGGLLTVVCENLYSLETGNPVTVVIPLVPEEPTIMYSTEIPNLQAQLEGKRIVPLKIILMVNDISQAEMGQNVLIDIATTDVDYKSVHLSLPEISLPVPAGRFYPDIKFMDAISGDFQFSRPELRLVAHTQGMGINFTLQSVEFVGKNQEQTVCLQTGEAFRFSGERQNQTEDTAVFIYHTDNSNIRDFMALPPREEILYRNGVITCSGAEGWLYADGKLTLDAVLRVPLEMSARELVFYDTISDLNLKEIDKILEAKLRFEGENGLKMNLQIPELYGLGEDRQILSKVFNNGEDIFPAATETAPSPGHIEMNLTRENLLSLSKSKYIVLKLVASTPDQKSIRIEENSRLHLKLKLQAKVDMGDIVFD